MCHKRFLHLPVIYFYPLIVTTRLSDGETDFLQTLVAVAVCSVPVRDNVADGSCIVAAVGVTLQTHVCAASRIVT